MYNSVMQDINLYSTVIIIGTSFTTNFAEQFKTAAESLGKELIMILNFAVFDGTTIIVP